MKGHAQAYVAEHSQHRPDCPSRPECVYALYSLEIMGLEEQLVQACERSDAPAVARLLQQGANPAAAVTDPSSYHYQWKPLHTTIYNAKGSSQVVELLVR